MIDESIHSEMEGAYVSAEFREDADELRERDDLIYRGACCAGRSRWGSPTGRGKGAHICFYATTRARRSSTTTDLRTGVLKTSPGGAAYVWGGRNGLHLYREGDGFVCVALCTRSEFLRSSPGQTGTLSTLRHPPLAAFEGMQTVGGGGGRDKCVLLRDLQGRPGAFFLPSTNIPRGHRMGAQQRPGEKGHSLRAWSRAVSVHGLPEQHNFICTRARGQRANGFALDPHLPSREVTTSFLSLSLD